MQATLFTHIKSLFSIGCLTFVSVGLYGCSDGPDKDSLQNAITNATNMPAELAECIAQKADAQLDNDGKAFLIASMQKDEATLSQLRQTMSIEKLAQTGMFMTNASAECGMPDIHK